MIVLLWRETRNAALFYESAYIKCSVEESMIFLWFLNLVLHIWCCTVFICLFSFFFSLKFAEAFKCLYSTWCTNRTEKWRHPLSKGNPLALITSYHFIQQHQMCLCFILLCTAVLYEYVVAIMLKKYIKTLHSSSDFLMCHFFSHTLDTLY